MPERPRENSALVRHACQRRYSLLCEFKSHDAEFDYLKSLEVEEKINRVRFCRGFGRRSCRLLATNDKTIKLWSVGERRETTVEAGANSELYERGASDPGALRLPRVIRRSRSVGATLCRVYANAHAYGPARPFHVFPRRASGRSVSL